MQKAEKEKAAAAAPKSTKYGDVRKCPVCGAMVPALAGTCPECGYEFSGVDANLSSKKLAEKLENEAAKWDEKIAKMPNKNYEQKDLRWECERNKDKALAQIIRSFVVPNTKADLFEFIMMSQVSALSPETSYLQADAYMIKYREAVLKAKSLFLGDKMFESIKNDQASVEKEYQKIHCKQARAILKPSIKFMLILGGSLIALIGTMSLLELMGLI